MTNTTFSTSRAPLPFPRVRLAEYLLAQVTQPCVDEGQSGKHERVYNFLHVPQKLEQVGLSTGS